MNFVRTAVLGTALVLAGCSSLNPFAGKNGNEKPSELVNFKPEASLKTVWSTKVGKSSGVQFAPAATGDAVIAASADGAITSIDLNTGATRWRINAGLPLTAGVGADGATVAVGANKGILFAFDTNGKLKWKAQASSEILSAPAVGEGLVVVRSIDNHITAFDASTGSRRWAVQRNAPALILRAAPGILIADQTVFVALPGGRLSALSSENGAPRWEIAVGDPRGTTELERIADVSGYPVLSDADICAVAFQGRIGCFDKSTGTPRWLKKFSSEVGLHADSNSVVSVTERGHLVEFAKADGNEGWRNEQMTNRSPSAPILLKSFLAVGDYQGFVHLLSQRDGSFAARMPTDGSKIAVKPLVAGSKLIVQTQSGSVFAFSLDN